MSSRPRLCPACHREAAAADRFCRNCGHSLPEEFPVSLDTHWAVAVAAATVGPFAIPLIWRSTAFSKPQKIVWTVMITIATIIICVVFVYLMIWSVNLFKQIAALRNELY